MSSILPGMSPGRHFEREPDRLEHVVRHPELRKILAFAGWTIDDLVNNPLARNDVRRWYKISRWMDRELEISDLERQWNPLR
jgi:hypothetical protein